MNSNNDNKTADFVHFRTQSSYSMLESAVKIDDLTALAKSHKMPAVALSDRGNLFASLEFALSAVKSKVQPIHGSILNIVYMDQGKKNFAEILLIAKDENGYQNLLKLVGFTFTKNDRSICNHITFEDLENHQEGIVVLSAYTEGIIGKFLLKNQKDQAILAAQNLQRIFGDRFYFEISRHNLTSEAEIEKEYLAISKELKIPLIATNQVLFSDASMYDAHDVLLCISAGVVRDEKNRKRVSAHCYFKSPEEMIELFKDLPSAIQNTVNLARRCYVMSEVRAPSLPNFTDGSVSESDLVKKEAENGLEKRLKIKFEKENTSKEEITRIRQEYFERLNYELGLICGMNFAGYFLIVSDFIRWSKENGIAVGPGRGSGAGSVVAWSLQITDLDPIKFGLLFERFLNPERISMPDFDIDFCQERRDEVITYVRHKYGDDRVGQIITFGKMQAKVVVKDVARVLGMRFKMAQHITDLVPFNAINPVTLSDALKDIQELKDAASGKGLCNFRDFDEQGATPKTLTTETAEERKRNEEEKRDTNRLIKNVLETALALEGLQRHASIHAAGIVIANQSMDRIVPIYKDTSSDMLIVQYSMKYCELSGLVKFDFLGLQTLTMITKCILLLKNQGITIDLEKLAFDDQKTFDMLAQGRATGVFQFESAGMQNALKRLVPDTIDDIIALGALYRPGPMDNIPTYIACKHKEQEVDYLHPLLEEVLKPTYGVIIYQEQVMEVARRLANYSLGAADLLRRAMGKKVKAEMDAQAEIFVKGAGENNVPESQSKSIFETVAKFAGYGFNKAHAAAYGVISYQTAYLKANFTTEFLVASLNLDIHDSDRINILLQEARNFDIPIIPPSINQSKGLFDITNENGVKSIVFALGAIKNVTPNFGDMVMQEREQNGPFKSIMNLLERMKPSSVNRKLLENMIKAGCFDDLHPNRNSLLKSLERLMSYVTSYHSEQASNQFSLIKINENSRYVLQEFDPLPHDQLAHMELDVLGLFVKHHPLSGYGEIFADHGISNSFHIKNNLSDGSNHAKIAGVIIKKDIRMSKRGSFVTLLISDPAGIMEVAIYNEDTIQQYGEFIKVKESVIINCEIYKDKGGSRITAKGFMSMQDLLRGLKFDLKLYPKNREELSEMLKYFEDKVSPENGNSKVGIFLPLGNDFMFKVNMPEYFRLETLPDWAKEE